MCDHSKNVAPIEQPFFSFGNDEYWGDLNNNGKIERPQEVFIADVTQRDLAANTFIKANPAAYWSFFPHKPIFETKSVTDYFSHPEKTRLAKQLKQDIANLEQTKPQHAIYTALLVDLKLMLEEIDHVVFRYPETGEVPDGFIGIFDPLENTMIVKANAPTSLLVHEMDHVLSEKRRIDDWSIDTKIMCDQGNIHDVPKSSYAKKPTEVSTSYRFSLDFNSDKSFTYDSYMAYKPLIETLERGVAICMTAESHQSALANEVRGYQTMARYLLFRIGITEEQLNCYDHLFLNQIVDNLISAGLKTHLDGSNLNPKWAHTMVKNYLNGTLDQFVNNYYTAQQAPGFADEVGCVKSN